LLSKYPRSMTDQFFWDIVSVLYVSHNCRQFEIREYHLILNWCKRPNSPRPRRLAAAIVSILKQQEAGIPTKEICRQHGISEATFYNWKSRYGGMEASDVKRLKDLEEENSRLKKMFADLSLDNQILKELFTKRGWALPQKGNWRKRLLRSTISLWAEPLKSLTLSAPHIITIVARTILRWSNHCKNWLLSILRTDLESFLLIWGDRESLGIIREFTAYNRF